MQSIRVLPEMPRVQPAKLRWARPMIHIRTMTAADHMPGSFEALSPRERKRLRLLALRYRVRQDTTLRPLADVMFDMRLRRGVRLGMGQVLDLVSRKDEQ